MSRLKDKVIIVTGSQVELELVLQSFAQRKQLRWSLPDVMWKEVKR